MNILKNDFGLLTHLVKEHGVRGAARGLGVTPAYVSLLVNEKRPLTAALEIRLKGLVNTVSVNNQDIAVNSLRAVRTPPTVVAAGAGNGIRTRDNLLGRQELCQTELPPRLASYCSTGGGSFRRSFSEDRMCYYGLQSCDAHVAAPELWQRKGRLWTWS